MPKISSVASVVGSELAALGRQILGWHRGACRRFAIPYNATGCKGWLQHNEQIVSGRAAAKISSVFDCDETPSTKLN